MHVFFRVNGSGGKRREPWIREIEALAKKKEVAWSGIGG